MSPCLSHFSSQDSQSPTVSDISGFDFCPTPPPEPGAYVPSSPEPVLSFPSSSLADQVTPCTSWSSLCLSMVSEDSELRHQKVSSHRQVEVPLFDLDCLDDASVEEEISKKAELSPKGSDPLEEKARKDDAVKESAAFIDLVSDWEFRSRESAKTLGGLNADQRQTEEVFRGNRKRPRSVTEEDAILCAKHRKMDTARVALSELSPCHVQRRVNEESSGRCRKRERPPSVKMEEDAFRSAKHRRKDTAGSICRKRKIGKSLRKAGKWMVTQVVSAGPILSSLRGLAPGCGWGRR